MSDPRSAIGTLGWAAKTGGALTFGDRVSLMAQGIGAMAGGLPQDLAHFVAGWHQPEQALDVDGIKPPDTAACKAAQALCAEASPTFMLTHCTRTWMFARLLGLHRDIAVDEEVLYVAGMLHDIALMDGRTERAPGVCCFTLPSAAEARAIGERAGWDVRRQDLAAEAILLNPNPSVPLTLGAEAHLLNAGVLIDAAGLGRWALHPDEVAALLEQQPRHQLKQQIGRFIHREADAWPRCRFHFARRWLQFPTMVRFAPWPE